MFGLIYLISFILTEFNTHDMMVKIAVLHNKTNYDTFYELFGVAENASTHKITLAFRKANKQKNTFKTMKDVEYSDLIMSAYGVLKNHRERYDYVLANSNTLFRSDKSNFKTNKLSMIVFSIFAIIMVDFSIFAKNYFAYQALPTKQRKTPPRMFLYSLFTKLRGN